MIGAACNRSLAGGNTARRNTGKAHLFGLHGPPRHAGRPDTAQSM